MRSVLKKLNVKVGFIKFQVFLFETFARAHTFKPYKVQPNHSGEVNNYLVRRQMSVKGIY